MKAKARNTKRKYLTRWGLVTIDEHGPFLQEQMYYSRAEAREASKSSNSVAKEYGCWWRTKVVKVEVDKKS